MSVVISDAWRQRFGGTARLYGEKALQCFAEAHVCVVGIGGVGSWAAEALARTGIGAITLIDMDDVCVTNTNRQIHALGGNVGLAKAEVMAERIRLINPECRVTVIDDFITPENVAEYLGAGFSYVIDAIDSVRPKAALIAWCRRYKVPLVTTGGAGGQIDPTQIQVADLAKTIQDPLAAKLRERLKSQFGVVKNSKGKLGIDCVFSTEALIFFTEDLVASAEAFLSAACSARSARLASSKRRVCESVMRLVAFENSITLNGSFSPTVAVVPSSFTS